MKTVNQIQSFQTLKNQRKGSRYKKIPFLEYGKQLAQNLRNSGKTRTSETYFSSLRSFNRFLNAYGISYMDIYTDNITSPLVMAYQDWLKQEKCCMNTISFYMRILRAIYNRAIEDGLGYPEKPFRKVYTGVAKTMKRAISLKDLKTISSLDLADKPLLQVSRDLFLFLFYMRGISFIDAIFLKKSFLKGGFLTYQRHKTGQEIKVLWEKPMEQIAEKYASTSDSPYIFKFIKTGENERTQYLRLLWKVNQALKEVGKISGLKVSLTTYVARHAWATIAYNQRVPIRIISEALGHTSETATRIYLNSINHHMVDEANHQILKALTI